MGGGFSLKQPLTRRLLPLPGSCWARDSRQRRWRFCAAGRPWPRTCTQ
jgi:hypothetical protein